MTPNELAQGALGALHPCPLADASYQADRDALVKRALMDYAENTQILSRVVISTEGETTILNPSDLKYITDVSDSNGEYMDHEEGETEITVIIEDNSLYPILINYAIDFSEQDLNTALPRKVQQGLLTDLIGAYFGLKNDSILQALKLVNVDMEPKDFAEEIKALKERIREIPVLMEPKIF